ncbi:MAG: DUF4937 domain-containing protein [Bacteroidales bacterium]|nr:DUF4937 domain-containing protein [Bacteroidales bacterium]
MYVKWMECRVKEGRKAAFSSAQEQWDSMARAPGFIAQAGGWDTQEENLACIVAIWDNETALSFFMKGQHDLIFTRNRQNETYDSIQISHFHTLFGMKGSSQTLSKAIRQSKVLRIADCIVKRGREVHFETMQQEVWLPGMLSAGGMTGGCFSKNDNNSRNYLVSTFWDNEENHERYKQERLPALQQQANIRQDLEEMKGRLIHLEDRWKI